MLRQPIAQAIVALATFSGGVLAQPATEPSVAASDQAALEARKAADAAQRAASAAAEAARAATAAALAAQQSANALRAALGLVPMPVAAPVMTANAPPSRSSGNENLAVERPAVATAPGAAEEHTLFTTALSSSVANGPNDLPLKSSRTPDLQLVASSTDKIASLAWSVDVSRPSRDGFLSADQFTLTASGKLDDSGQANLVGLRGFPNGTEVKLSYTHFGSRIRLSGVEKPEVATARRACLAESGAKPDACNPYDYATGASEFVRKYNPSGLDSLRETVLPGPVWYYGAELAGNQAGFKYLDRPSFSIIKESQFGFSATAFAGMLLGSGNTALGASATYRRSYDEQDPVTLCQVVAATTFTRCITAPDGRPDRQSDTILSADFRHAFALDDDGVASLALAPELSVDLGSHSWSVDVPLYFAPDKDSGKLRGGVRGVYLNEPDPKGGRTDSFTLGLFVGVPFSVFH